MTFQTLSSTSALAVVMPVVDFPAAVTVAAHTSAKFPTAGAAAAATTLVIGVLVAVVVVV
jgi:hypothetical protein